MLMNLLAALDQQRVVGDLLSERVLEDVVDAGRRQLLVNELGRLQIAEHRRQLSIGRRDNMPDQAKR
jgi:hypothetical protein